MAMEVDWKLLRALPLAAVHVLSVELAGQACSCALQACTARFSESRPACPWCGKGCCRGGTACECAWDVLQLPGFQEL